jgi:antitoxin HicB
MTSHHFTIVLEPDREEPERYNVRVPALPGCRTYGESLEDGLANAREAIAGYMESLVARGLPVPVESHPIIATSIVVRRMEPRRRDLPLTLGVRCCLSRRHWFRTAHWAAFVESVRRTTDGS